MLLPADGVRHSVASHADDVSGQRPVVAADFGHVADLVNNPGTAVKPADVPTHATKRQRELLAQFPRLRLTLRRDGVEFEGVFELSTGRRSRSLSLKTLYVRESSRYKYKGSA